MNIAVIYQVYLLKPTPAWQKKLGSSSQDTNTNRVSVSSYVCYVDANSTRCFHILKNNGCLSCGSYICFRGTQDVKGGDAEEAAARKEGLRAKMMEKSRDGQRWALVCFFDCSPHGTPSLNPFIAGEKKIMKVAHFAALSENMTTIKTIL